jgi:hypothetical protein
MSRDKSEAALAAQEQAEHNVERRRRARRPLHSPAWADPGGILPVIDCKIIDLTDEGARVTAAPGVEIPDVFQLQIDSQRILGAVEVVWRGYRQVGVKFLTRI